MWLKWLPWRFLVRHLARSSGFLDPMAVWSRLHRFAQPSEVAEPVELLRAGAVFHARGLMNARAIQHNLDWVWPFWVERQFDPTDPAFVPRAFSITHVNLTNRNWTAVGRPGLACFPIVDPRGLVTAGFDGWSIDAWIIPDAGEPLLPSRAKTAAQRLHLHGRLNVETRIEADAGEIAQWVEVVAVDDEPLCRITLNARSNTPAWLAISVRPANPEGISFVHDVEYLEDPPRLIVNRKGMLRFSRTPDCTMMSDYRQGDVLLRLRRGAPASTVPSISCDVGMATAAALFRLTGEQPAELAVSIPLHEEDGAIDPPPSRRVEIPVREMPGDWDDVFEGACTLEIPDERMQFLFEAAARSLLLHCPGDVFPGPFTYRRFWFRDAAYILDALLVLGLLDPVEAALLRFPQRQGPMGYFRSQSGEWDSNGEAIWIIDRYRRLRGADLPRTLVQAVIAGAKWIQRKRLPEKGEEPHAGLMPAGFSAEHLGPSDYYYWDDFWSVAGLRAAADIAEHAGRGDDAAAWRTDADHLLAAIDRSIDAFAPQRVARGVPASPYRRMDAGAIGSIVAGYPLQLWSARDSRLLDTVEYLLDHHLLDGAYFHDVMHSGINVYLTLQLAQTLMRAGDDRHEGLVRAVADLASPTGQWPEAIHPGTGGGCMGDGQHMWAAAEWILALRNSFVREDEDRLIIGSGLRRSWLAPGKSLRLGPTPTPYGPIDVRLTPEPDHIDVGWRGQWRGAPPPIEIRLAGFRARRVDGGEDRVRLPRAAMVPSDEGGPS